MQVLPVNRYAIRAVFKGHVVEDHSLHGYPETHLNAAKNTNKRYEKTLGTFHTDAKNKIYYADPLEKIDDALREKVDYIFYDDEPRFPLINEEVSKAYFFEPEPFGAKYLRDYKQEMEKYKQYFYRMEMADSKHAGHYYNKLMNNTDVCDSKEKLDYYSARIADAKYNQETAGICMNIMDEANGKIDYKNDLVKDIRNLDYQIKGRYNDITDTDKEIENRTRLNSILEKRLENLKSRLNSYNDMVKNLDAAQQDIEVGLDFTKEIADTHKKTLPHVVEYNAYKEFLTLPMAEDGYRIANQSLNIDKTNEKKEISFINSQLKFIKSSIEKYTAQYDENKAILKKASDYKMDLPKVIAQMESELKQKTAEFEKVKAELIPYFDKLKNYFYSRGLRQVKY